MLPEIFIARNRIATRVHVRLASTASSEPLQGNGTPAFAGDGGAATGASRLNTPTNLAFDSLGNIYISDYANNRIRQVSTNTPAPSPSLIRPIRSDERFKDSWSVVNIGNGELNFGGLATSRWTLPWILRAHAAVRRLLLWAIIARWRSGSSRSRREHTFGHWQPQLPMMHAERSGQHTEWCN